MVVASLPVFTALDREFPTRAPRPRGPTAPADIPTLAHAVWTSNVAGTTNIPLAGIIVGNGALLTRAAGSDG